MTFAPFFLQPPELSGVTITINMSENTVRKNEPSEKDPQDPLWDLIRKDASAHASTLAPSPWFASRTVAKARCTSQSHGIFTTPSILRRILLPIPLVGLAALLIITLHIGPKSSPEPFVSSEAEFEQHMEMLASSDPGI